MKSKIILSISCFLVLLSCKKGDTGPKGDAGPAGNANVVSTTYVVNTWQSGSSAWFANLNVPALTSSNINSAAVSAFFTTNGSDWFALPYTQVATTNYFMNYASSIGNVQIQWVYNGVGLGSNPNSFYGVNCQFKVVVIPPALIRPDVDYKNYEELKQTYNIKD